MAHLTSKIEEQKRTQVTAFLIEYIKLYVLIGICNIFAILNSSFCGLLLFWIQPQSFENPSCRFQVNFSIGR